MIRYLCSAQRRLRAVAQAGLLNGIDYVEVRDTDEAVTALRQRTLYVRTLLPVTLDPATGEVLDLAVVLDGGERITAIEVEWIARADALPAGLDPTHAAALVADLPDPERVLVVRTAARGDFSRYRLRLVAGPATDTPPAGFDPLLVEVDFSFKVECPSDFDCGPRCSCRLAPLPAPAIDYLVKDYQGFRRLMLERMALLAPSWTERNPADVGVALVEALAYAADELSYRQDAVATEAFLHTARSRVSLRRHARLVDYRVHEGCNARAWVHVAVGSPTVVLPAGTPLLTRVADLDPVVAPDSAAHRAALGAGALVFATVDDAALHADLNRLELYTWGEEGCCLPRGATGATLRGHHPQLRAGDVVVLAETASPTTTRPEDADADHRQAVRLVAVTSGEDPSGAVIPDGSTEVTEIRWHEDDALRFPLHVTATSSATPVAAVFGNIVLADHGALVADEPLGTVPAPRRTRVRAELCDHTDPPAVPARFRPALAAGPLTHAVARPEVPLFETVLTPALQARLDALDYDEPLSTLFSAQGIALPSAGPVVRGAAPLWSVADGEHTFWLRAETGWLRVFDRGHPAGGQTGPAPRRALPAVSLQRSYLATTDTWLPQFDLLGSGPAAREFVVETEHDGTALLRFGDSVHGKAPESGSQFTASYRVGNGTVGNVAADAIRHVVTTVDAITEVTNLLPAAGGVDPEPADAVRRDAPHAFAVQQRAVTERDYAEVTERHGRVQRAAATFRWTGSWHTVFVTADRLGGLEVDPPFRADLRRWLERFRMAGYDLQVDSPVFVPLEVTLSICVARRYFRADVAREVRDVLSSRDLADGRRGLFHPDNLTFGEPVYKSALHAAVHSVPGVASVEVTRFRRQHEPASSGIDSGVLEMGRLEIARLDDDPTFPERGVLTLTFGGGS